jgi:hypothetical protein
MQGSIVRKALIIPAIACLSFLSEAQPPSIPSDDNRIEKTSKPFRILTTGKQVTIKSTKNIKSLMVWTSNGHRIVEEKNLNTNSYNFRIQVNEKIFFVMVQLVDGKTYSEKIGVQ